MVVRNLVFVIQRYVFNVQDWSKMVEFGLVQRGMVNIMILALIPWCGNIINGLPRIPATQAVWTPTLSVCWTHPMPDVIFKVGRLGD